MAETIALKVAIDTSQSAKSLGDLEKSAEDLTKLLKEAEFGTKEFKELNSALRDVNKQIKNTELSMEALDNEQVASEIGSVAGAVGDLTGAFILLGGDEDSALGETAKRIETALGITMAFKGAIEGFISFQKLWNNTLKQTAIIQGVIAVATKAWAFVTQGATLVTKALRLALLSLPFVAIGAAIAGLIAYWDDLVSGIKSGLKWLGLYDDSEEQAQARAKARLKEERKLRQQRLKQIENSAKREQDIHDNRIANLDNEIRLAKAQGKNTIELEKEKLDFIIQSTKKQNELTRERIALQKEEINLEITRLEGLGSLTSKLQKADEKLVNLKQQLLDLDQEQTESTQAVQNAETDLLVFEIEADNERREAGKKRSEERKKEAEERLEKEKQALFDLEVAKKEADAKDILDAKEKAEALINIEVFKHEKELENKELTDAEKQLLEFEHQQRIAEISQEFVDAEMEREKAEAERLAEVQKEKEEKEKEAREKKDAQDEIDKNKRIEREKEVQNAIFDLASGGIDALIQLNDAFQGQTEAQQRKAFERNKKLQIAQALIGASQGVVNILANASTIPDPFGTVYKVGQLAILAAVTTAQIAKISQQQFNAGGSASAPAISGAGGGAGAPTLSPITNTSTLVPQEPQQVFVTETDITNTQNKVAVIETQATIK
jgi:hypothetical protein